MTFDLITLVGLGALALMLVNLYSALSLKGQMSGGMVGRRWNLMILLVLMFAGGYLVLPFLKDLNSEQLRVLVSAIFFFGAIYVFVTIRLIYGIIRELAS